MPTYINHHPNQYITFSHQCKSYNLGPGAVLETPLIMDNVEWLRRIDDAPFYNHTENRMSFHGEMDDVETIPIDWEIIDNVKIDTNGCIDVYINSLDNTPPHRVNPNYGISLDMDKRVDKLLFKFLSDCNIDLILYKKERHNRI
jgi:hypothetical protein